MGHIKMMAATQPFLSGAISKTVNLPQDCSVDDIAEAYMQAWRLGIKAIAIYRDNSKGAQPLNVQAQTDADRKGTRAVAASELAISEQNLLTAADRIAALEAANAALNREIKQILAASTQNVDAADAQAPPRASRHRLPGERASVTHKFAIAGHEGYITVGLYPNGYPGEIFIRMAKEGSTVSGLMDSFATAISISLQHGVPLRVLCEKFAHTRFEPSGWTGNPEIGFAKSIMDYIFRWIQIRFLSGHQLDLFANMGPAAGEAPPSEAVLPNGAFDNLAPAADASPQAILQREARTPRALSDEEIFDNGADSQYGAHSQFEERTPPRYGIAPEPSARTDNGQRTTDNFEDRGLYGVPGASAAGALYHPSDAMKGLYDMGDAPSCATCGAIMTRSGSCYRCMSCGSTSGCS
jgi:ribonucleoside-diphosphate reductase alpha chain